MTNHRTQTAATATTAATSSTSMAAHKLQLLAAPLATAALVGTLAGCGGSASTHGGSSTAQSSATAAQPVDLQGGWVKTAKKGDMTAVFGTLASDSDAKVTVTGAQSSSAGMAQLHETVNDGSGSSKMQEKKGGFTIGAHKKYTLKPGGDHIMLMDLNKAIKPGATVDVTLKTSAGQARFSVVAKDYSGAKEHYDMDKKSDSPHSGHASHSGHADHS